jgi:hypothetical protein
VPIAGPESSKTNVRFVTPVLDPASDMRTTLCPAGPTNSTSRSGDHVCENPQSVAVTFWRLPSPAGTVILDGYGVAAPDDGTEMLVGFETGVTPAAVAVAVPLAVRYSTVTGTPLAADNDTVKVAFVVPLLPSASDTSLIER